MTALLIILGIILFFVIILSIPVYLDIDYTDAFRLTVQYLFIKIKIYPNDKPKKEGVSAIEKIIGRKISESKIMKNMKTNKRTITESQLRNIVAESIRKVLKESAFRYTNTDDFLHFLSSQGEDPMPFVYNAMKEMNLENKFDFRSKRLRVDVGRWGNKSSSPCCWQRPLL